MNKSVPPLITVLFLMSLGLVASCGGDVKSTKVGRQQGVVFKHYADETFTNLAGTSTIGVIYTDYTWSYESSTYEGTVLIPTTGEYQFLLQYAPGAELTLDHVFTVGTLQAVSFCPAIGRIGSAGLPAPALTAGTYYPFLIRHRSGCSTVSQYVRFLWMKPGDAGFTMIPSENLFFP